LKCLLLHLKELSKGPYPQQVEFSAYPMNMKFNSIQ
jgi:hypothetical protein